MRSIGRLAIAALLAGAVAGVPATGASAAAARARHKTAPVAPVRGWLVPGVRFEPLDPAHAPLFTDAEGAYRGAIEVRRTPAGLASVNVVGFDDYLKGISEVPVNWPPEAQRAQAIAARTYALYEMLDPVPSPWRQAGADLCATDSCQVYRGVAKELRPGAAAWSAAVDATRGQVLLWQGRPILAKYSSSNGGQSTPGGYPYLPSVPDPDDTMSPLHHWRYAIPLDQLGPAVGVPGQLFDVGRAGDSVILTSRLPDGTQAQQAFGVDDFRAKLDAAYPTPSGLPLPLPSRRYTVVTEGDAAVVDGWGWGHGVGMSQYGALGKALRGMAAPQILASYYGGLRPASLRSDQVPSTVRVALAVGQAAATVTANGHFRVLGTDGHVLAALATGRFRVEPGPGGSVHVLPPAGYDQPLSVGAAGVDPGVPLPGQEPVVHVRLSTPAVVQITAREPGGRPLALAPRVLDGDSDIRLPAPNHAGEMLVIIAADAGPGRVARTPFSFRVAGPTRRGLLPDAFALAPAGRVGRAPALPVEAAALAVLALVVAAAAAGWQSGRK